MSGVMRHAVTEKAALWCGRCGARWESPVCAFESWRSHIDAAQPAFDAGWRVFIGARTQHTYCPDCGPTVAMRLLYPSEEATR